MAGGRGGFPGGGGGFPGQGQHQRRPGRSRGGGGSAGPDLYSKESPVLRVGSIPSSSSERVWLLHFYTPTSRKSIAISKMWTKLAGGGYLPESVKVGAVNCDKKPDVCEEASTLGVLPVGFWVRGSVVPIDKKIIKMAVQASEATGGELKRVVKAIRALVLQQVD